MIGVNGRSHVAGVQVVRAAGGVDLQRAATGLRVLSDVLAVEGVSVVCDLAGVEGVVEPWFLMLFPAALRRAGGWPSRSLRLAAPTPAVARTLHRLGMARFLPVHADLATAMSAAVGDVHEHHRRLPISGGSDALSAARGQTQQVCDLAGLGARADDAQLIVTEMYANALRHARAPATLDVVAARGRLLVAVTDPSPAPPVIRPFTLDAEGGRGMALIEALADSWGVQQVVSAGKTVWASVGQTAT